MESLSGSDMIDAKMLRLLLCPMDRYGACLSRKKPECVAAASCSPTSLTSLMLINVTPIHHDLLFRCEVMYAYKGSNVRHDKTVFHCHENFSFVFDDWHES